MAARIRVAYDRVLPDARPPLRLRLAPRRAADRACCDSALCEAARRGSRLRALLVARERLADGRAVAPLRADLAALAHFARGFEATLTVDNVFDKDPPHYPSSLFGILYDTANATALGRYVSLQLLKQW